MFITHQIPFQLWSRRRSPCHPPPWITCLWPPSTSPPSQQTSWPGSTELMQEHSSHAWSQSNHFNLSDSCHIANKTLFRQLTHIFGQFFFSFCLSRHYCPPRCLPSVASLNLSYCHLTKEQVQKRCLAKDRIPKKFSQLTGLMRSMGKPESLVQTLQLARADLASLPSGVLERLKYLVFASLAILHFRREPTFRLITAIIPGLRLDFCQLSFPTAPSLLLRYLPWSAHAVRGWRPPWWEALLLQCFRIFVFWRKTLLSQHDLTIY